MKKLDDERIGMYSGKGFYKRRTDFMRQGHIVELANTNPPYGAGAVVALEYIIESCIGFKGGITKVPMYKGDTPEKALARFILQYNESAITSTALCLEYCCNRGIIEVRTTKDALYIYLPNYEELTRADTPAEKTARHRAAKTLENVSNEIQASFDNATPYELS